MRRNTTRQRGPIGGFASLPTQLLLCRLRLTLCGFFYFVSSTAGLLSDVNPPLIIIPSFNPKTPLRLFLVEAGSSPYFAMGWSLSQWVAFARATQLLGALAVVGSHGYLTVRVKDSTHGLTKEIIVLELMVFSQFLNFILSHQRTNSMARLAFSSATRSWLSSSSKLADDPSRRAG
jgi:hypothetical protein